MFPRKNSRGEKAIHHSSIMGDFPRMQITLKSMLRILRLLLLSSREEKKVEVVQLLKIRLQLL